MRTNMMQVVHLPSARMFLVASEKSMDSPPAGSEHKSTDFIRQIVEEDLRTGATAGRVATRFPPEPNGFLHIGHAKSICLNFGVAQEFGGQCHLRFDDTNPETEDMRYVEAMQKDIRWLGFEWEPHLHFASDYFEQLYEFAVRLIEGGKAYVDDLNEDQIREYRGTVTDPGRNSPFRDRSVDENIDLFQRMRIGEFADGAKVLRAKINMAHPNMKMRDPLMYRIRHAEHYRRGNEWCIYPMYDWAHGQSDAIEGITHSICTLEFENNRELYDWFLINLGIEPRPHQYEFARLYMTYTLTSKRKLLRLVEDGFVSGWDDPRMLTLAGLRRRGYTPDILRAFTETIGVARVNSRVEFELLEYCARNELNYLAPRVMCVLRPLKVVITNYPEDATELLDADYWPRDVPKDGVRPVPFTREIYIERDDFMEVPVKNFRRLSLGEEVRLRYAYVIRCTDVVKDPTTGELLELHCTYDPETRGGAVKGRKVKGTIHWVSAHESVPCTVRLYDRLFAEPNPDETADGGDFVEALNPTSLEILDECRVERSVLAVAAGTRFQFERHGYFIADALDTTPERPIFNRIVALRDSWATPQPSGIEMERHSQTRASDPGQNDQDPAVGSISFARAAARQEDGLLAQRFERYQATLGLSEADADMLTGSRAAGDFFEEALATHDDSRLIAAWIINDLLPLADDQPLSALLVSPRELGELVAQISNGTLSNAGAKKVLAVMLETGAGAAAVIGELGLTQINDTDALLSIIDQVIEDNPAKALEYREGKTGLLGYFVGQVMRSSNGRANPQLVNQLLERKLAD